MQSPLIIPVLLNYQKINGTQKCTVYLGARNGTWSRRYDAKPSIDFGFATRLGLPRL